MKWKIKAQGAKHFAAVRTDGTLWTWGSNEFGQLGDGTTTDRTSPVQIGSDTDWSSVIAGDIHTLALKKDGTIYVWGGQNVIEDETDKTRPRKITRSTT